MHAGLSFLCAVALPAYFSLSIFAARMKSLSVSLYPGDALLPSNFSRLIHAREHASPPTLDNHPVSARIPRRRLL
jgi:hypothetical protein